MFLLWKVFHRERKCIKMWRVRLAREKCWDVFFLRTCIKIHRQKESRLYHLSIATFPRQPTSSVKRYGTNNFSYVETKSQSSCFYYREKEREREREREREIITYFIYFYKFFDRKHRDNLYLEKSGCSWWNRKRETMPETNCIYRNSTQNAEIAYHYY